MATIVVPEVVTIGSTVVLRVVSMDTTVFLQIVTTASTVALLPVIIDSRSSIPTTFISIFVNLFVLYFLQLAYFFYCVLLTHCTQKPFSGAVCIQFCTFVLCFF